MLGQELKMAWSNVSVFNMQADSSMFQLIWMCNIIREKHIRFFSKQSVGNSQYEDLETLSPAHTKEVPS